MRGGLWQSRAHGGCRETAVWQAAAVVVVVEVVVVAASGEVRVMSERCVVTHGTHGDGSDIEYHLSPRTARRDPAY